jgi:hypothetical protein
MKNLVKPMCFLFCFLMPGISNAGIFTDDLSRCLVIKTTDDEKIRMVRWFIAALGQHTEIRDIVSINTDAIEQVNREMGNTVNVLFFERCSTEANTAIKNEGEQSIVDAFKVIGGVAARTAMQNDAVNEAVESYIPYVDMEKLEEMLLAK